MREWCAYRHFRSPGSHVCAGAGCGNVRTADSYLCSAHCYTHSTHPNAGTTNCYIDTCSAHTYLYASNF
ncbi:MAG: hypothetical protein BroJett011_76630 [Chloroflexota bacterium]|nr:MAG: hypothetical protein BroJett011_76630 [Chloroflexota bacterium]